MTEIHYGEQTQSQLGRGRLLLAALLVTALDLGAWYVLDRIQLAQPARTLVALLSLPGDVALLAMVLVRIRRLDEFQKRVQLEAVSVAFLSTGVAVFVFGYLQKAHAVGPLNMELVWAFMLIFYAVGYLIALGHYK